MPEKRYHSSAIRNYDNMRVIDIVSFLVVSESNTFRQAAERLYITPQGMGYHIQTLEKTLGVQLFVRTGKHLRLTKAGEKLKAYAVAALDLTENMHAAVAGLAAPGGGAVAFAYAHSLAGTEATDHIEAYRAQNPGVQLDIRQVPDGEALRLVTEEGYPALAVAPAQPGGMDTRLLRQHPYTLLVNNNHPLAGRCAVSIQDLEGRPLILPDTSQAAHGNILYLCRQAGFEPVAAYLTGDAGAAARLVQRGWGCALLPRPAADMARLEGVVQVPLAGPATWDSVLALPAGYEPSGAERLFFSFICGQYGQAHGF